MKNETKADHIKNSYALLNHVCAYLLKIEIEFWPMQKKKTCETMSEQVMMWFHPSIF